MQNPVRYYIVKADDDQPVVRTVPVTVRPADEPTPAEAVAPTAVETPDPTAGERRPARVGRIVRSAIRRTPASR